jgi:AcrR family transcriptional regulator
MGHRGSTRDAILDAFEDLLRDQGERAATLASVARVAGVSKGGLLYHFGSKADLVAGEIARLEMLAQDSFVEMQAAPDGAVAHFIRTSVYDGMPFDRAFTTVAALAQSSHDPNLATVLQRIQERWLHIITDATGNPTVARLVMLMSDGLYYASLFPAAEGFGHPETDEILTAIDRLLSRDLTIP